MANHSPEKDNYTSKRTWDAAMEGKKADIKPEGTTKKVQEQAKAQEAVDKAAADARAKADTTRNEARGNGGGK